MKRITIILSLKEKKAITEQARHLHLCRCTGYIGGLGHQRQKYLDTLVRDIFRI